MPQVYRAATPYIVRHQPYIVTEGLQPSRLGYAEPPSLAQGGLSLA
ncbi:MAG: hypothetical protein IKI52_09200 [Clostridia bacterium]|nr:hypothetical protein [Clostridia bacterium]